MPFSVACLGAFVNSLTIARTCSSQVPSFGQPPAAAGGFQFGATQPVAPAGGGHQFGQPAPAASSSFGGQSAAQLATDPRRALL